MEDDDEVENDHLFSGVHHRRDDPRMTGNFNTTLGSAEEREPTFRENYNVYATSSTVSINQCSSASLVESRRGHERKASHEFNLRDGNRPLITPVAVTGGGQNSFDLFPED